MRPLRVKGDFMTPDIVDGASPVLLELPSLSYSGPAAWPSNLCCSSCSSILEVELRALLFSSHSGLSTILPLRRTWRAAMHALIPNT